MKVSEYVVSREAGGDVRQVVTTPLVSRGLLDVISLRIRFIVSFQYVALWSIVI